MFNYEIVSKVKFDTLTEADITKIIADKIAEANPNIVVNSINFIQRKQPARIEAEIDASFKGDTSTAEQVVVVDTDVEPVIVNETLEEPTEVVAPFVEDSDDAVIDAALDAEQLAELNNMDSQFEQDDAVSLIDEIEAQTDGDEVSVSNLFA